MAARSRLAIRSGHLADGCCPTSLPRWKPRADAMVCSPCVNRVAWPMPPSLSACKRGGTETMTLIRHDWTREEIAALFELPFNTLLWQAQSVHRQHHDPNAVQLSTLLSIKTGGCAE